MRKMRKRNMKLFCLLTTVALMVCALCGCGSSGRSGGDSQALSYKDAVDEMSSMLTKIKTSKVTNPVLDIYSDDTSEADALADIDTFPITVRGNGDINIEIAGATEMTNEEAPDDFLNIMAKNFNRENFRIGSRTVSVTVRKITSGEVVTYMKAGAYQPQVYIPSAYPWGEMLKSSGVGIEKLTDRIAGNTAGILMKSDVYDEFIKKYEEATLANVLTAAVNKDILFAYTNPYTSTTGLNGTAAMLAAFDPEDPLSDQAANKLMEYQKTSPPVAYTTGVLRNQAAKGVVNTMLMEEQAYINTAELKNYKFIPFGVRHDHPVYTFDYCSEEEKEAAQMFTDYCLKEENQKLATEKGFNRHDDYVSQDPGLDGTGWMNAQKVWKENKNGGKPIVAVFIADTSGSMDGTPLNSLKTSLVQASSYISLEHYIGLVSYAGNVTVNLPVAQSDATQRAYFSGEVKNLSASGNTATYDAVLVGLNMLAEKAKELPDAKLMLFVLTDGEQNEGYSLDRITPIVEGMQVPVYSIAYNYDDNNEELDILSGINEAATLKANSEDIVNQLRNLFNVEI